MKLLKRAQGCDVFFQKFLVLLLRLANGLYRRWPLAEGDFLSGPHSEILGINFHLLPSAVLRRAISPAQRLEAEIGSYLPLLD